MASASTTAPPDGGGGRMSVAASNLGRENQTLIDLRKALGTIKMMAEDLERDNRFEMVKELEDATLELLAASDDAAHFSSALQSIGMNYRSGNEATDFKKLIEKEVIKLKEQSSFVPQSHPLFRQFKEVIWNVHHAGEPMPGEEQEEVIMTTSQSNILNITCPLSGKPVIELENPVRSMDCKHIYEEQAIKHYMRTRRTRCQCPVAGCPKILEGERVTCDPLLRIELDEMRARSNRTTESHLVEDFTELDDNEDD
ncbi:E3 SUMO-protein ligase MMS21 isoform X2 [Amborella trichopoda]|uniref:E3 SUMO-protein ligase MMS21 isoform X2 n=1 Tax=Amborella trichopoda TaxID=13333 RepID=UPI0009BEE9C6|nr:E3 SUMO-protein ligase MMS21 isoform X2 [Amborella trichopoda]|eukprot:XP_020527818.1 E3 SUMO-protein ligase MMS21 isoform X2 [Amborella trichopoda]